MQLLLTGKCLESGLKGTTLHVVFFPLPFTSEWSRVAWASAWWRHPEKLTPSLSDFFSEFKWILSSGILFSNVLSQVGHLVCPVLFLLGSFASSDKASSSSRKEFCPCGSEAALRASWGGYPLDSGRVERGAAALSRSAKHIVIQLCMVGQIWKLYLMEGVLLLSGCSVLGMYEMASPPLSYFEEYHVAYF